MLDKERSLVAPSSPDFTENPGCFPHWVPEWVRTGLRLVLGEHIFASPPIAPEPQIPSVKKIARPETFTDKLKQRVASFMETHRASLQESEYFTPGDLEIIDSVVRRFLSDSPGYEVRTNVELPKHAHAMFRMQPYPRHLEGRVCLSPHFDENSDWQLLILIHELAHADHFHGMHEQIGPHEFARRHNEESERFGSNAILLLSELRSWMIQLLLIDHLSGGLLHKYVLEAAPLHAQGGNAASKAVFDRYLPELLKTLSVPNNETSLVVNFMRLSTAVFAMPRRDGGSWPRSFVLEVARDQARIGIPSFEYLPPGPFDLSDSGVMQEHEYLKAPAQAVLYRTKNGNLSAEVRNIE